MAMPAGIKGLKVWQGDYDFAVDGGAVGTITLRSNDGPMPNGAVVAGGYLDITTACASATGTMALQAEAAGDVLAATTQAGLTVGVKAILERAKTTVSRDPALVIATAAFTAGKFSLVLIYR